ncbi:MAG: AI-2E family transporter [Oscillatoriales cyanobacterium CG2_30_44_21]|nr:MAG: AI-2E family transporter [Oscillatoriales cyanobacterium CG2_30_44_21]
MIETLNKLPRWFSLGLTFPLIFLNGWLLLLLGRQLQPLVSILITATVISFLLDYPIRFLTTLKVNRGLAAGLVILVFFMLLGTLAIFLVPLILAQANELLVRLPEWIKSGQQQLQTLQTWAIAQQLPIDFTGSFNQLFNQLIEKLTGVLRSLTTQLFSLVFGAIGSIVNIFLTLIFSIFLVVRGSFLWNGLLGWLPPKWNTQVRNLLPRNFERFIVGQVTLATILGVSQTTAMLILGVPFAQLFGFGIGLASLIPLGGSSTIITVSLLIALQNFWLGIKVLLVAVAVIQVVENVLGPRIVGELTGLNPVWMLISLDVGFKLNGVLGLFVAVPIAGFIKGTFDTIRGVDAAPAVEAIASVHTEVPKK